MFLRSLVLRRPSLFKEQLRERCANGATIAEQLAAQPFHQMGNRGSIIDLACSQAAGKPLASITRGQVQLLRQRTSPCWTWPV